VAVVVGAEHAGLGPAWAVVADVPIRIPMAGSADSLNAGIAAAVVLYEAARQRSRA
jgi:tRNA G18 (ribose-2'-O)-methylase SpoU